jgi:hypothetical protein
MKVWCLLVVQPLVLILVFLRFVNYVWAGMLFYPIIWNNFLKTMDELMRFSPKCTKEMTKNNHV